MMSNIEDLCAEIQAHLVERLVGFLLGDGRLWAPATRQLALM